MKNIIWSVERCRSVAHCGEKHYWGLSGPPADKFNDYEDWGFVRKDDAEAVAALLNERRKARKMAARKKGAEE